jgi:hypothetical protein
MSYEVQDREGRTLCGPMPLREALEAAEPGRNGVRLAVSSPNADYIAVQLPGGKVRVRCVNEISGRAGSVLFTGRWVRVEECSVQSWRPA